MKNLFYFFLAVLVLSSCASTKPTATAKPEAKPTAPVLSPVGDWNFTITGTPDGDFAGVMTVAKAGEILTAALVINGNALPIENFAHNKETNRLSGELNYSGLIISFDALLTADEINGVMAEGGAEFPFKATRKK